jgi:DNA polymerase sigma
LAQIAIYINAMGWVTSCSTYFNAKVPVVKLEIDPSVGYFTPKRKADYYQGDPCVAYGLDLKEGRGVSVRVDITVCTGEGVSGSTELMRGWLEERPSLQRVLLALKYSLAVRGYSENFKGGIGSYCLFVMVAAYFVQFVEGKEECDCEILLDILKFYG